jgi:hypothetical protein
MLFFIYPVYGQMILNNYYNIVLFRYTDPYAEAMGKIQSVGDRNYFTLLSNPAIDNSGKEISAYFSYGNPYYVFDKAEISSFGVTYNTGTIGSFGLSMESFEYNQKSSDDYYATDELYSFSYSNNIFDIVNFGIDVNLVADNRFKDKSSNAFFFDIGLSKKFSMYEDENLKHELNSGLQIVNVTGKKIENEPINQLYALPFPSVLRIGLEDVLTLYKNNDRDYKLITLKTAIEYEDLLNVRTLSTIKFGAELNTLELLSLRIGYYYRFEEYKGYYYVYDGVWYKANYHYYDYSDGNVYLKILPPGWRVENYHHDYSNGCFTFGVGLNLDFKRLLNGPPIALTIDFVNLKQKTIRVEYIEEGDRSEIYSYSFGNFHTVLARLRYHIN